MVDGIGGNDLMTAIFDLAPDAARPPPAAWAPEPEPSTLDLMIAGLQEAASAQARQLERLSGLLRQPLPPTEEILDYGRGLAASARRLAVPSAASLNGPIGPGRRWAWAAACAGRREGNPLRARRDRERRAARGDHLRLPRPAGRPADELEDGLVVRSLVPVSRCAARTSRA